MVFKDKHRVQIIPIKLIRNLFLNAHFGPNNTGSFAGGATPATPALTTVPFGNF
jgi:hypothetical protein